MKHSWIFSIITPVFSVTWSSNSTLHHIIKWYFKVNSKCIVFSVFLIKYIHSLDEHIETSFTIRSITCICKLDELWKSRHANFKKFPLFKWFSHIIIKLVSLMSDYDGPVVCTDCLENGTSYSKHCIYLPHDITPPFRPGVSADTTKHRLSPATNNEPHCNGTHQRGSGKTAKLPSFPPTTIGWPYHPCRTTTATERWERAQIHPTVF